MLLHNRVERTEHCWVWLSLKVFPLLTGRGSIQHIAFNTWKARCYHWNEADRGDQCRLTCDGESTAVKRMADAGCTEDRGKHGDEDDDGDDDDDPTNKDFMIHCVVGGLP